MPRPTECRGEKAIVLAEVVLRLDAAGKKDNVI
jgi:hypothetical protein